MLTAQALQAIQDIPHRFLRTTVHPAAVAVPDAASFDHLYESADTFAQVYEQIAHNLVDAATAHGKVLYAVPGSPGVLEHAVTLLQNNPQVETTLLPAVSFLDLAWTELGIDPVEAGARLIDGHTFAVSAAGETGPLLVAHCHNQRVLSDIKLAVEEPGDATVTVLQRLGLPDQNIVTVPWAELDRAVQADHLTSIWIPELAAPVGAELLKFAEMVQRLRRECPWDREQTHGSLRRHLIEEAYEVLDAIDGFDARSGQGADHLEEELGDLLFQVFIHAVIAAEEGWFTLADVARTVHDKLYARHPHVYGDAVVDGVDDLLANWEVQKREEKGRASVMEGIPAHLPGLALAEKVVKKSAVVQADVTSADPLSEQLVAVSDAPSAESVGKLLFSLVALARDSRIDPEMALRDHTNELMLRVSRFEGLASKAGIDPSDAPVDDVATWWSQAASNQE